MEKGRSEGSKQKGEKREREDNGDKIAVLTVCLVLATTAARAIGEVIGWMKEAAALLKGHPMGEGLSDGKRPGTRQHTDLSPERQL